jgi:hypothetical protein
MRDRIDVVAGLVPGIGRRPSPASRLALLLAFILLAFLAAAGCGGGGDEAGEEGAAAEGEGGEGGEDGEAAPARPATPPPAPKPPPPKPAPPKPKPGAKPGAKVDEPITVKRKKLPDNKIIEFLFNPEDIAKYDDAAVRYPGAIARRNIFRDIKYSTSLKNVADAAIGKAAGLIAQIQSLPEGSKNDVILKKAVDNLRRPRRPSRRTTPQGAGSPGMAARHERDRQGMTAGEDKKELSSGFVATRLLNGGGLRSSPPATRRRAARFT